MRFDFIVNYRGILSQQHLCQLFQASYSRSVIPGQLFQASDRGLRAYRPRPPGRKSREDLILSAHIRAQARLFNFGYGRIRMTLELRDSGVFVGNVECPD